MNLPLVKSEIFLCLCTAGLLAIGFRQVTVDRAHHPSRRTTAETSVACRAVSAKLHSCAADEGSGTSFVW